MTSVGTKQGASRSVFAASNIPLSPEHYLRVLYHRKWLVLAVFVVVAAGTAIYSYRLPNVYTSETLILVDPQKVPENYVKPTVTGDIRNRLGTLSQQILSETRLQRIIETFNLFPDERKTMAREDVIAKMRAGIGVSVVSDFGATQDLQAFRITYNGPEPRQVAQVANQLASLFIEENLKAREQQATGTTEFLTNQLGETRKALEEQEARLRDFKLKHIGELPEQQASDLQILAQMQTQLQAESDALGRAEQQRNYFQSMMAQPPPPVVDLDDNPVKSLSKEGSAGGPPAAALDPRKAQLASLLTRYTEKHPEVQKLKREIAEAEAKESAATPATPATPTPAPATPARAMPTNPTTLVNPVLRAQVEGLDAEIEKHKQEVQRLRKLASTYQAKLEAIPVREQEAAQLVRDYEMSKAHYSQLLDKQLSAETATQLEIRQKGERFSILDPAQPAEKPSRPNRPLINAAGSVSGLGLGILLALCTEFLGMSITAADQISECSGIQVLGVIPTIRTRVDRRRLIKRLVWVTASGVATVAAFGAVLLYRRGL